MKLRYWIKSERGRGRWLSEQLHIPASYLSQIASGAPCSVAMAINIEKLTVGAVRVESLRPADEDFAYLRSTEKCAVELRLPHSTPI